DAAHHWSDYQIGVFAWEQYDHFGFREYIIEKLGGRKAVGLWGGDIRPEVAETIDSSPLDTYQQMYLSGGGTCSEDGWPFGMHPYEYVNTAAYKTGEPVRILAFSQGASLSISQSLLVAELNNCIPVTDSARHQRLFGLKYKRAIQNRAELGNDVLVRPSLDLLQIYAALARNVLLYALPRGLIDKLSIDALHKYREANKEALQRFWMKIREMSHELTDIPLGKDLESRIVRVIDKNVVPEMQALQDSFEKRNRTRFGSLLSQLATVIPASVAVSVVAGLSPWQIVAFGASTALAGFGLSIPALTSHWQKKREARL